MLNQNVDLGDAGGLGHMISMTPFDDGSVVLASFNPDSGTSAQVVLMPCQWRSMISLLETSYSTIALPRSVDREEHAAG